jgi:glycosyltransferase involved in cell wall biosynthesis
MRLVLGIEETNKRARVSVGMLSPSESGFHYTHQLCNALVEQGCDVHLYTSHYWNRMAQRFKVQYHVHPFFHRYTQSRPEARGKARVLLRLFEHVAGMAKLMAIALRYNVIHVQWLPVPILDVAVIRLLSKFRPIVYTVHNLYPHNCRKTLFLRVLLNYLYRTPRALIAHTQYTVDGLLHDFGVEPARIYRINHGNDSYLLSLHHTPLQSVGRHPSSRILFFGNISKYKALDVLLRAMPKILEKIPSTKLAVVGIAGVDVTPCKELVQRLALSSSVEFRLGYVEESELPAIFESASVVALPYRVIDQSGVAITACTFGKAIVATDVGGLKELVQNAKNGILVPINDEDALAEAIVKILENETLRKEFERNSRSYSDTELNWDFIARQTSDVYKSICVERDEE